MAATVEHDGDAGTWTFTCGLPQCGFTSVGHESKAAAQKRRGEHMSEHEETT